MGSELQFNKMKRWKEKHLLSVCERKCEKTPRSLACQNVALIDGGI